MTGRWDESGWDSKMSRKIGSNAKRHWNAGKCCKFSCPSRPKLDPKSGPHSGAGDFAKSFSWANCLQSHTLLLWLLFICLKNPSSVLTVDFFFFFFHSPSQRNLLNCIWELHIKLLYQPILNVRKIDSLHLELWELESVFSLLDFLSFSS